jgi:hypothetical protein
VPRVSLVVKVSDRLSPVPDGALALPEAYASVAARTAAAGDAAAAFPVLRGLLHELADGYARERRAPQRFDPRPLRELVGALGRAALRAAEEPECAAATRVTAARRGLKHVAGCGVELRRTRSRKERT